jgi:hypothetical protein
MACEGQPIDSNCRAVRLKSQCRWFDSAPGHHSPLVQGGQSFRPLPSVLKSTAEKAAFPHFFAPFFQSLVLFPVLPPSEPGTSYLWNSTTEAFSDLVPIAANHCCFSKCLGSSTAAHQSVFGGASQNRRTFQLCPVDRVCPA